MRVVLILGILSLLSLSQCLPNFGQHDSVDDRAWNMEKVDLETTVIACAANNQFANRLIAAFDNCRQYDKNPKGKGKGRGILDRQGKKGKKKGKKGKKGKKSKKGKGKGSKKCMSSNQLLQRIQAKAKSIP